MDEKTQEDKQETASEKSEVSNEDSNVGDAATEDLLTKTERATERLKEETDRRERLLKEEKNFVARKMLSGNSGVGQVEEKPKKLTDVEYAEALQRGEVDPLREDGFAK